MHCSDVVSRLGELLVGALPPEEDAAVLGHLERCGACSGELGRLGSIGEALRAAAPASRRARGRAGLVAAVALAAAAVLAFVLIPSGAPSLVSGTLASSRGLHGAGDRLPQGAALTARSRARVDFRAGRRFEPFEGARFCLTPDSVALDRGSALVAAEGDRGLPVATSLGSAAGPRASFRISIEEPDMNRTVVAASALAVTISVVSGVVFFTDREGQKTSVDPTKDLVVPAAPREIRADTRAAATSTAPADVAALESRVAALTRERDALQARVTEQKRSIASLEDTNRRLSSTLDRAGAAVKQEVEVATSINQQRKTARELADLIGLDEGRQKEFESTYEDIKRQIRDLEAQKAKVTVDGNTTTIEIPRFEDEGKRLTKDWNDWLERSLTPDERRRYERHQMFENLFHSGIGTTDKTITLRPEGKEWRLEVSSRREGEESGITAQSSDLDSLISPWRHLIPPR